MTTIINPTSKQVSEIADFGHVFAVGHSGNVVALSDEIDHFPGALMPHAPELLDDPDTSATSFEYGGTTWELPLSGFTGQYGYKGPWLHDSEMIEGGVGDYVLAHPGFWVAIYGSYSPENCASCNGSGMADSIAEIACTACKGEGWDEENGEYTIEGWTLAYKPFDSTINQNGDSK